MVGVGVAGLLASRHLEGPAKEFLRAHGANVSFSFGAVFLISLFRFPLPALNRPVAWAALAFVGVSAQEIAQGLGLYPGCFDPWDFLYNAIGAAAGLAVALAWRAGRGP
jgi:hypothetical protein